MFNAPEIVIIGFDYINATELEKMQRNLDLLYGTRAGTCPGGCCWRKRRKRTAPCRPCRKKRTSRPWA